MPRVEPLRSAISKPLRVLGVIVVCLGLAGTSLAAASGGAAADPGAAVVAAAEQHLGDSYTWGGTGPHTWDCSGLTSVLWRTVGGVRSIPRTAQDQQSWAVPLPAEQVQPGDLVFFGDPVTHVGLVRSRTTTRTGTTVHMIDASSSRKGVVERDAWTTQPLRFGRVPRPGMTPVAPWTPPAPKPTARPTASPSPTGTAAPAAGPRATTTAGDGVRARAAVLARGYLGSTQIGDVDLVRAAWQRAGGAALPTQRDQLARGAREVTAAQALPGDLVSYGPPVQHVGVYLGRGQMVDASRALGKVVVRAVWPSAVLHYYRLPA